MSAEVEDLEAMRLVKEAEQALMPMERLLREIEYEGKTPANCAALLAATRIHDTAVKRLLAYIEANKQRLS